MTLAGDDRFARCAFAASERDMVASSSSTSTLSCPVASCTLFREQQVVLLQTIAYTPLSDVYRLLRCHMGEQRGYSPLGDIPYRIQAPGLLLRRHNIHVPDVRLAGATHASLQRHCAPRLTRC